MSLRRALLLLLLSALVSCRNGSLLPRSGGQLYEVLLVGDTAGMVRSVLSADVEGLPQPEPSFDVSEVCAKAFGNTLRYPRNIVIVDINAEAYTRPSIRSERNVWHSLKPWCISGHRQHRHSAMASTASDDGCVFSSTAQRQGNNSAYCAMSETSKRRSSPGRCSA